MFGLHLVYKFKYQSLQVVDKFKYTYYNSSMEIERLILDQIKKNGSVTPGQLIELTGKSRQYIARIISRLIRDGLIQRTGFTNKVEYASPKNDLASIIASRPLAFNHIYDVKNLNEENVYWMLQNSTNIVNLLPRNASRAFRFGFTEMLNNAIDHSNSGKVRVEAGRTKDKIFFSITDRGIGIFKNIADKMEPRDEAAAVNELLKGKVTTSPEKHTGQGIFFTSRAADTFTIESSTYQLLFDTSRDDIFLKRTRKRTGTKVAFELSVDTDRDLSDVFNSFSSPDDGFFKSEYHVNLYAFDDVHISRSQAKRLMHNLDKFKIIVLDFDKVEFIGQGFADEVFRVWQNQFPNVKIQYIKATHEVDLMIKRALANKN
ncbi:MAG: DUF4325 domain-containing protein [Candidatus Saccharimonadales bacterium]